MSFLDKLRETQNRNNSRVCVGLDPDPEKLPVCFKTIQDSLLEFGMRIVDATAKYACIFKPNQAFWAHVGAEDELAELIHYIYDRFGLPVILDAKRGDIGNTARFYAKEAFERYGADACTINAYLGTDTLEPWLGSGNDKAIFVLCHTTNPGAGEFQEQLLEYNRRPLFVELAKAATDRGLVNSQEHPETAITVGLVMAATFPEQLVALHDVIPDATPLLIPGIGKQKGELESTLKNAQRYPFVINSSGAIIHASRGSDFAAVAAQKAKALRDQINEALASLAA
nr:hypothetical protein [uncultured bacterium]